MASLLRVVLTNCTVGPCDASGVNFSSVEEVEIYRSPSKYGSRTQENPILPQIDVD